MTQGAGRALPDGEDQVLGPDGVMRSAAEHAYMHRIAIFCSGGHPESTAPFVEFLDAGHELIHWIGQHIEIAQRLDLTIDAINESLPEPERPTHSFIDYSRSTSKYSALWNKVITEKIVGYYLVYIARLLTSIFIAKPETLRSSAQVRVDYVLRHESMAELIRALADEQVSKLAYKGMRELATDVEQQTGLAVFRSTEDLEKAIEAIEIRNVLVHNNGVVNSTMARKLPQYSSKIGSQVGISNPIGLAAFFAHSAASLDGRARAKFGLESSDKPRRGGQCGVYVTRSKG